MFERFSRLGLTPKQTGIDVIIEDGKSFEVKYFTIKVDENTTRETRELVEVNTAHYEDIISAKTARFNAEIDAIKALQAKCHDFATETPEVTE